MVNILLTKMDQKMIEAIKNWEAEYRKENFNDLTDRERELLNGSEIRSHEGMVFGRMYADWKKQKGYD